MNSPNIATLDRPANAAATPQLNHREAEALLSSIQIPPQPEIVVVLMSESRSDSPDLDKIIKLISKDAGIAAAVLKSVNSPYFGFSRKMSTVQEAVMALGMKNISALVMGLALRNSMPVKGMEQYWEGINRSAQYAAKLARHLGLGNADEVQMYVLFHDSAMPLLLQRFPAYLATMKQIPEWSWVQVPESEDARHNTNHVAVGSLLARNWGLSETVREAIQWHHDPSAFLGDMVSAEVRTLVALGYVADQVERVVVQQLMHWEPEPFGTDCLNHLMLGDQELQDFIDAARDQFGKK